MKARALIFFGLFVFLLSACQRMPKGKEVPYKEYTIEQFYKTKQNLVGVFSPDETTLLITSNESGILNLHEINIADGSQRQVTASTADPYYAIEYVPGTNKMLYSSDKAGNEISHIYLLHEDGKTEDLTPGEKEKTQFIGWDLNKKAFFYQSSKRDPKYFDLYKFNVADRQQTLVHQNDQGYEIAGVSWDEKYITLLQNVTSNDNKLYLLELATNTLQEVSEPNNPGKNKVSGFSKDGKSFFYITNADKEFAYLVQYDLATDELKTIYETNWDVMWSRVSENEKYRVVAVNEGGKNKLILLDYVTGNELPFPEIPDGNVNFVIFSPSEKLMRLTVGTSKSPSDLYVYSFESKELKRLTNTLNPEIDPTHLVAAEVVRYPSFDGLEIPAIYYKPLNASAQNKVPALVYVHAGPGAQSRTGYSAYIQYLVNHGYAVLAVNNRGSSGYGKTFFKMDDLNHGDKDLEDCVYGKKYLQTLDYIDPDKIGIMGGSYGGYMTMAALAFRPEEFKVGVNLFGVTNWIRTLHSIPPFLEFYRQAIYAEVGDPNSADSVRLRAISPLFHAHRVKNPVLVLQGANDPRVLQVESDEIVAAVKKNNVPVEYIIFPDEGHGFVKKENEIKGYSAVLAFLDTYLKGKKKQNPI